MSRQLLIQAVLSMVMVGIGIGVVAIIRTKILARAPIIAFVIAVSFSAIFIAVISHQMGYWSESSAGLMAIGVFVGAIWVQPQPRSISAICISLAAAVGFIAVAAAIASELLVASVSAAACGYLLNLGGTTSA